MGVVNVTPDSFSDGGRHFDTETAVAHGRRLLDDGADILDIGGESTRPGAARPSAAEELDRVVPVISALAGSGVEISVDTMRAEVAEAALAVGASIVNDVSGGLADPRILAVVAAAGATYVAMHWRGHSDRMQDFAVYDAPGGADDPDGPDDVVTAVCRELGERVTAIRASGIAEERIVLDPGLGFAKTAEHNWALLRSLDSLRGLGCPLLVGASRKAFLGQVLAGPDGTARAVMDREAAGVALTVLLAQAGVWGIRVHDVRSSRDALRVVAEMGAH
ncbi:MAG: dihydropteroate synthase [Nocardioidaceae bacterium]